MRFLVFFFLTTGIEGYRHAINDKVVLPSLQIIGCDDVNIVVVAATNSANFKENKTTSAESLRQSNSCVESEKPDTIEYMTPSVSKKIPEILENRSEAIKTPTMKIMTKFLVGYSIRKKIFDEVANDGDMIKTFDSFNPLYLFVLFVSSIFSLSDMRHSKKIPVLQTKVSNPIYRWVDAFLLIVVITLMKNVKNAI